MAVTPPPVLTLPGLSPDRSDRTTFSARSIARDDYIKNVQVPQLALALANVAANAADAATSAANAQQISISNIYRGALSADPATRVGGFPNQAGDEYFSTAANLLKRFNGSIWQASDLNTANLAASTGAGLVGLQSSTVFNRLSEMPSIVDRGASTANSAAANAAIVTTVEALSQSAFTVPDGTFSLPDSTVFAKEYSGPGKWSFGGTEIPMTRRGRIGEVIKDSATVLGDLMQFYRAIQNRSANVVFCGDSITEGLFQTSYEDSWAFLFADELRRRLSGVSWNIQNLSLAGLGIGSVQSPAFVGGAANDYATTFNRPKGTDPAYATSNKDIGVVTGNPDVWPNGSSNGKTWRDHLRDASPDLLIIAHGQNDVDGNSAAWAASCKAIIAYSKTWAKPPSIAIVTACPATRKQATWRGYGPNIQVSADAARGVALEMGCTLIDANRQYLMLRDGADYVRKSSQAVPLVISYPSGWSGMSPMPTLAGNSLTWGGAGKIYNSDAIHNAQDIHYVGQFAAYATGQAFGLIYRGLYEAQVNGAVLRLYYGVTVFASVGITPLVGGTTHQLEVVCVGARHQILLDGVKLIDVYDYNNLTSSGIGIEMNGPGTVGYPSMIRGVPRTVGPAVLTEDELLGISSADYWTNPLTKGGDGIHHPSSTGHYSVYFAASLGLVNAAERIFSNAGVMAVGKTITPSAANNALSYTTPNIATSYLSYDGFVQLGGSLIPNGATTIAAGVTAATLDIAHVPNREVDGVVYIAGAIAYCRILTNGNILFGANVTAGQFANMDGLRFRQNN